MRRCDRDTGAASSSLAAPVEDAARAAGAARRLDDAFRGYIAERGAKPVPLAEVTSLVTGVGGLRLAADAVLDLWQREDGSVGGDRAAAREELLRSSELLKRWYEQLASSLLDDAAAAAAPPPRRGRRRAAAGGGAPRPERRGRPSQRDGAAHDLDGRSAGRGQAPAGGHRWAGAGRDGALSASRSWTERTALEPSPTAAATRFIEP